MQTNEFYLSLLEEITEARKRMDELYMMKRSAWLLEAISKFAQIIIAEREGLSFPLIKGRLIQLIAIIFAWIEWIGDKGKQEK